MTAPYAELHVTSNYSFLRGASHVEELLLQAKALGLPALGLTDRNTLAGIVRAHQRAEEVGIRLVVGCRLDLADGVSVLVYPTDRPAYSRLCRLLTIGKARAGKGKCDLGWDDLAAHAEGLIGVLLSEPEHLRRHARECGYPRLYRRPKEDVDTRIRGHDSAVGLGTLREAFGDRLYLALTLRRRPGDAARLRRLAALARNARVPTVATGDVLYHVPRRRILQDVLTCIREGCTIDAAGFRRERSADRHLQAPAEMARRFAAYPDAVARSLEIVARCPFSLTELRYQYPDEIEDPMLTPQQTLERLVWESAPDRYPDGVPDPSPRSFVTNSALIEQLAYAPYFLTVHSIVRYARGQGHPVPGPRQRGELGGLLRARDHRDRSGALRPAVRAVRLRRTSRAARYRRRFRA